MTFIVLSAQCEAIKNGEPVSSSVLREFLAGALPHFWNECSDLAFQLIREPVRPRLAIPLCPDEPARQVRLGMALVAYRRLVAEQLGCQLVMPNPSEVMALKPGERLSETPCISRLPAAIHKSQSAGYAAIQGMANALTKNPTSIVTCDMREMYAATRQDLALICSADSYRTAMETAFNMRIAMQCNRIAGAPLGVESEAFDSFCSIEQLIGTWQDRR